MNERFKRTALLIGEDAMDTLKKAKVIVFGAGGVGGAAVEALARGGVGEIHVVDPDALSESNINRQLLATTDTVGINKAQAACDRIKSINPDCIAVAHQVFYTADDTGGIDIGEYDFVIDAIDTVSSKLFLIEEAKRVGTHIICSMGTGNKLDPTRLTVSDISKTNTCPLAAVIRREL
ncbi:MAG: ThiF family adenylyltransferase, partial [Clostridia bacterium]|nr:ThiF family adenylyltransferase [Clostridia bacterium]